MLIKDYLFTLSEVPDELSLCFRVSGCTIRCEGCHSPELATTKDSLELDLHLFKSLLKKYNNLFTCVLFMGGEKDKDLVNFLNYARDLGYKTCLYTGADTVSSDVRDSLTFLKTGKWCSSLGGLTSKKTNQKFLHIENNELLNYKFWK